MPTADEHPGAVQRIECAIEDPAACHSAERSKHSYLSTESITLPLSSCVQHFVSFGMFAATFMGAISPQFVAHIYHRECT